MTNALQMYKRHNSCELVEILLPRRKPRADGNRLRKSGGKSNFNAVNARRLGFSVSHRRSKFVLRPEG